MQLTRLGLYNFRNYASLGLTLHPRINLFVGNNAQGKTNLLEAIYMLAMGKSFRAQKDGELIKYDAKQTVVRGKLIRDAQITLEVQLGIDTPKKLSVNQKYTTPGYFIGHLNAVLFVPDDLQLIKGSPKNRRAFMDAEIAQVSSVYRDLLAKYSRVLSQRNQLLKESAKQKSKRGMLPLFDEQLVEYGSKIILKRSEAIRKLGILSRLMHRKITSGVEELSLVYFPFFIKDQSRVDLDKLTSIKDHFHKAIQEEGDNEIQRGYSLVGPQRDDLVFEINNKDARSYASQGQQRTAVLSCRLAEMEFMKSETGKYPVVLLDDVMSELDLHRRKFLLNIMDMNVQTIITTTHINNFSHETLGNSQVFYIEDGKIRE